MDLITFYCIFCWFFWMTNVVFNLLVLNTWILKCHKLNVEQSIIVHCFSDIFQVRSLVRWFPYTRRMGTNWQTVLLLLVISVLTVNMSYFFFYLPKLWTFCAYFRVIYAVFCLIHLELFPLMSLQCPRPKWISGVAGSLWHSRGCFWLVQETGSQHSSCDMWPQQLQLSPFKTF